MNPHDILHRFRATPLTARLAAPLGLCSLASLCATLLAANPVYVSGFAEVTRPLPYPGNLYQDTGQLIGQTATTAEVSFNDLGQNSSAIARAEMGHLGVRVFAGSAGATAGAIAVGIAKFSD